MPAWLTAKLFWKVAPYLGGAIALILAVWYIDHRGYARAEAKAKLEKAEAAKAQLELRNYINQRVNTTEGMLADIVTQVDQRLHTRLSELDIENRTIVQPTLVREIQSNARFSDPQLGITDGMFQAINKARAASSGSCARLPDGGIRCSMPESAPAEGQDNRDASDRGR